MYRRLFKVRWTARNVSRTSPPANNILRDTAVTNENLSRGPQTSDEAADSPQPYAE